MQTMVMTLDLVEQTHLMIVYSPMAKPIIGEPIHRQIYPMLEGKKEKTAGMLHKRGNESKIQQQ